MSAKNNFAYGKTNLNINLASGKNQVRLVKKQT